MSDYRAKYREKWPERVKESRRRWAEKNREHVNAYARDYQRERTPNEVLRARNAVERAIKNGRLVPQPCEHCGKQFRLSDGRNGIQAHHDDYSKPLEIRWLCYLCHRAEHREERRR